LTTSLPLPWTPTKRRAPSQLLAQVLPGTREETCCLPVSQTVTSESTRSL
jgi:hypothetical protein